MNEEIYLLRESINRLEVKVQAQDRSLRDHMANIEALTKILEGTIKYLVEKGA